jgi:hypothetical protein
VEHRSAERLGVGVLAATIQAPPVPCRLTGTPACRATEPS